MEKNKREMDVNLPAGTIMLYAAGGENIPDGWLPCDGTALESGDSRYTRLFLAIGKKWNRPSDREEVFRVPDLGYMPLPQASAAWGMGVSFNDCDEDVEGQIIYIIKT